jgi:hypothetical protein
VHSVEHAEAHSVRQAAPRPEADVDAAACETPQVAGARRVGRFLETDEVGLRLVQGDRDRPGLQLETSRDEGGDVARPAPLRQVHGPRHERAVRLVPGVAREVEGLGDEHRLFIRPRVGVADSHRRRGGGGGGGAPARPWVVGAAAGRISRGDPSGDSGSSARGHGTEAPCGPSQGS